MTKTWEESLIEQLDKSRYDHAQTKAELADTQEELQTVLDDWNALCRAIGSTHNGTAVAHAKQVVRELQDLKEAVWEWLRSDPKQTVGGDRALLLKKLHKHLGEIPTSPNPPSLGKWMDWDDEMRLLYKDMNKK